MNPTLSLTRKKILIADDEANIRLLVRSTLEDEDMYQIIEAVDGQEALDQIRTNGPEIAILDLMMPRVSGLDVLEELRKHPPKRRPVVVVLTAKVNEEQRALAAGADEFLRKPFSPLQLMDAVEKALDMRG
ncbi:MAG: response regulator [Gammaproteobacteria bacterium]|nr:MAG: response regulator [Gammaproteobacteria bacterium]